MNKIYIKKRILKQQNKDEEEKLTGWTNPPSFGSHMKRKKKRKVQRTSDDDDEFDPYWTNINKSSLSISNYDNHGQQIEFSQLDTSATWRSNKVSREEKKLQYYLDMIQRQERAENKKRARKTNKAHKSTKEDLKNSKFLSENFWEPELVLATKFNVVQGSDPELDILAKYLNNNVVNNREKFSIDSLVGGEINASTKYNKDDIISWSQSEDQNESTFDRLRTPTQNICRNPSLGRIHEEITGFENFRISSLYDKASVIPGEQDLHETWLNHQTNCLKEDFWNKILRMTKQRQESLKTVSRSLQTSIPAQDLTVKIPAPKPKCTLLTKRLSMKALRNHKSEEINIAPILPSLSSRIKPVFAIERVGKGHRKTNSKLSGMSEWTEASLCRSVEAKNKNPWDQPKQCNEAVILI